MARDFITQKTQQELWNVEQYIEELQKQKAALEERIAEKQARGAQRAPGKYQKVAKTYGRRTMPGGYKNVVVETKGEAWIAKQKERPEAYHEYTVMRWESIVNPNQKPKKGESE